MFAFSEHQLFDIKDNDNIAQSNSDLTSSVPTNKTFLIFIAKWLFTHINPVIREILGRFFRGSQWLQTLKCQSNKMKWSHESSLAHLVRYIDDDNFPVGSSCCKENKTYAFMNMIMRMCYNSQWKKPLNLFYLKVT